MVTAAAVRPDALTDAIEQTRVMLAECKTNKIRVRIFWSARKHSRDMAPPAVIDAAFLALATETKLIAALGRHGAEDVQHILKWAAAGTNPFGGKSL